MWLQMEETQSLKRWLEQDMKEAVDTALSFCAPATSHDLAVANAEHRLANAGYVRAIAAVIDELTDNRGESNGE